MNTTTNAMVPRKHNQSRLRVGSRRFVDYSGRRVPSVEKLEYKIPTIITQYTPADRERDYQIVVPIANPENVEQLMYTAVDLARDRNGEVLVLSVVTLPEQTPLSVGYQYTDEQQEVLNRAMAMTDDDDVPVNGTIRISHQIDRAILNTVNRYNSDAVLIGWGGWRSRRREIVLGSTVDTVVIRADCDVLVKRIDPGTTTTIESMLLPTAGGPHSALTREIATAIAHTTGAQIEVLRVVAPDASPEDRADVHETITDAVDSLHEFETKGTVVEHDDIGEAIIARTAAHDLTVIGATRESLFQRVVFGAIPERVGEHAESTVILARRHLGIPSRLQRLFN
jgi:APA family basic amino acid/polyamine antiporter